MSLPLPRRFAAQAALLLGAAAAPLIGAGAAHAAALPPQGLSGLTAVDGAGLGDTVDGASQTATRLTTETGTQAVRTTVPATGKALGTAGRTAAPTAQHTAQHTAGSAADTTGRIVGATAESLPAARLLPNTGALPVAPLGSLPLG